MNRQMLCIAMALVVCMVPSTVHARLRVVATVSDLGALVREVTGDDADVVVLASPDLDPHYVDGKPSFLVALSRADILVVNGMDLEIGWLPPLLANARNSAVQVGGAGYLDASQFVHKLEVPGRVDRSMGDIHVGGSPHYLFDPRAAAAVIMGIAERCAQLDSANAAKYQGRANASAGELLQYAAQQKLVFQSLAPKSRSVVVYHRSIAYVADWLGLQVAMEVEPKPGVAPDPARVAAVLQTMRAHSIDVLVQEVYYPKNTMRQLANLTGAKIIEIAGGPREGESYLNRIKRYVEPLYAALAN